MTELARSSWSRMLWRLGRWRSTVFLVCDVTLHWRLVRWVGMRRGSSRSSSLKKE